MPKTLKRKPIVKIEGFHFDKENHVYTLDGIALHGVTTILSVIAKPMLIQWSANMAVDTIEKAPIFGLPTTAENQRWSIDPQEFLAVCKEARTAHRRKKEDAGTKGTDVHAQIEQMVKTAIGEHGGVLPSWIKSENSQVQKFVDWARENNVRFLESEKRVLSKEGWYAGTLDLILELEGAKWIADVKTSSAIYPEHYFQMAAYQNALEEMGEHLDIKGAMVLNLNKKGGFEIGRNYDYTGNRLAFQAALVLHKQLKALKN